MRFIFEKHMFFLLILAKSLENTHDLPMIFEFQQSLLYHNKRLQGTTTPDLLDNLIDVCFPTYRGQTWKPVIRQSHSPGKSPGYPCSERGVENGIQKVERTAIRQIGPCFRPGSPCLEVERHGGAL